MHGFGATALMTSGLSTSCTPFAFTRSLAKTLCSCFIKRPCSSTDRRRDFRARFAPHGTASFDRTEGNHFLVNFRKFS